MNPESHTIVIKPRDYRLSPDRMDAVACEWVGRRVEVAGAGDDWHYEFERKEHADGFKQGIRAYAI